MLIKQFKKIAIATLIITLGATLTGCTKPIMENTTQGTIQETTKQNSVTFTDALEREITIEDMPSKVVALSGSFGELWLNAGGSLVGVTDDIDNQRDIDSTDMEIVGTIKEPNLEAIIALDPDFVILAKDTPSHVGIQTSLEKMGIPTAFLKVEVFPDYEKYMKIFTDITKNPTAYTQHVENVSQQISQSINMSKDKPSPTVLLIRAYSTGAKAKGNDTHTGVILEELGCDNIVERHSSLLDTISFEAILQEDPDFILVAPMGSSTDKALKYMKENIENNAAWAGLSAVQNDRYIILPKDMFHYKPNARWGEAYEYMYNVLYGEK